jgi:hypothetical protein
LGLSKRYPENHEERVALLGRHNTVADHVVGAGESCFLFVMRFDGSPVWSDAEGHFGDVGIFEHAVSCVHDEAEADFFVAPLVCNSGRYDRLILATADDLTGPVLIANMARATAYAPYDGGADLIFPSRAEATEGRQRFARWLSRHPSGM